MTNSKSATDASGDLFPEQQLRRREPVSKSKPAPELATALVLCRRLRAKPAGPDKKRIAHLICLNLMSMLRHGPQRS